MIGFAFGYLRSREGATSIEYALIASFIALVIVAAVGNVGTSLDASFRTIASSFP